MPNKYAEKKEWNVPKQRYKLSNWSEYSDALRRRGEIDVWLSEEAISLWYEKGRVYDGSGTPKRFSDFAILTCHEIRQVYRLPLVCADFSCLSKRLGKLGIKVTKY